MQTERPLIVPAVALPMIVAGIVAFAILFNERCDWLLRGYVQAFLFDTSLWLVSSAILIGTGVALLRGKNTARLICAGICCGLMFFAFVSLGEGPIDEPIATFVLSFLAFDQLFRPRAIEYFAANERIHSIFDGSIPEASVDTHRIVLRTPTPLPSYKPLYAPWAAYALAWIAVATVAVSIIPSVMDAARYPQMERRYRTAYQQISYGATTDQVYELMGAPEDIDYKVGGDHFEECSAVWYDGYCSFGWDRAFRHNSDTGRIVLTFEYRTPVVPKRWIVGFDREGRAIGKYDPDD